MLERTYMLAEVHRALVKGACNYACAECRYVAKLKYGLVRTNEEGASQLPLA